MSIALMIGHNLTIVKDENDVVTSKTILIDIIETLSGNIY